MSKRPEDRASLPVLNSGLVASFLNAELGSKMSKNKKEMCAVSQLGEEQARMQVTEVPLALLENPWRKLERDPWTQEVHDKLKGQIQTHKLTKDAGIENINVLLLGEISAGKSSFFNSVESVFAGYVTNRANAGMVERSLTTQYRQYVITARDKKKKAIKFKYCDSMGLEGGAAGLSANDVGKIMDGHVEELAELTGGGLMPGGVGYNMNPTEADRIHCVCFVVSALAVSLMDEAILDKFKAIRTEANGRNLLPIVILTRADQICQVTEGDTSKVFHSSTVFEKVNEVSKKFGINLNQIFPVRNYSVETECELETDLLILRAQRQILRNSEDYLLDKIARHAAEDKLLKKKLTEMKKRDKAKKSPKHIESSQEGGEDEESAEEEESEEEDDDDSDSPAEKKKPKKKHPPKHTSYSDSEYTPGKVKGKGQKAPPSVPKAAKAPPAPPTPSRKGVVLYHYSGDEDDGEIRSLEEGEEVTEVKPDKDGWTTVRAASGRKGRAPTNYVDWTSKDKGKKSPPKPPKSEKKLRALHQYNADGEDEVDLDPGDEVLELDPDDDGWTRVRKEDGGEGLVPTNYLGQN